MTGCYVEFERNNQLQRLEIEELTTDELHEFLAEESPAELSQLVVTLVNWIKNSGGQRARAVGASG
jgi:hypothetical protein